MKLTFNKVVRGQGAAEDSARIWRVVLKSIHTLMTLTAAGM